MRDWGIYIQVSPSLSQNLDVQNTNQAWFYVQNTFTINLEQTFQNLFLFVILIFMFILCHVYLLFNLFSSILLCSSIMYRKKICKQGIYQTISLTSFTEIIHSDYIHHEHIPMQTNTYIHQTNKHTDTYTWCESEEERQSELCNLYT